MRRKFPLVSMGGRAEGLACADPGARTPIGASGNIASFSCECILLSLCYKNFQYTNILETKLQQLLEEIILIRFQIFFFFSSALYKAIFPIEILIYMTQKCSLSCQCIKIMCKYYDKFWLVIQIRETMTNI